MPYIKKMPQEPRVNVRRPLIGGESYPEQDQSMFKGLKFAQVYTETKEVDGFHSTL